MKAELMLGFFFGCIAPMVEQLIPNQCVGGSSPSAPASYLNSGNKVPIFHIVEKLKVVKELGRIICALVSPVQ